MSFIPLKKNAHLLSLLIISCITYAASATDSRPDVFESPGFNPHGTPAAGEAVPEKITPDVASATPAAIPEQILPVAPVNESSPPVPLVAVPPVEAVAEPSNCHDLPQPITKPVNAQTKTVAEPCLNLNSEEQKRAYASGVAMAHYIDDQIAQQKTLFITLDRDLLLAGIIDTFNAQEKMSDREVKTTLSAFEEHVKVLTQAVKDKNLAADKLFLDRFAKREGVKKSQQGLLYLIDNQGEGPTLKNSDTVEVSYKGTLIDGTVIDGPPIENSHQVFRVSNMAPVLRDSVKRIRKSGRITVVIPPTAVETVNGEMKPNRVVIYTISVIEVNKPRQ